jgi:hypothetical protein
VRREEKRQKGISTQRAHESAKRKQIRDKSVLIGLILSIYNLSVVLLCISLRALMCPLR